MKTTLKLAACLLLVGCGTGQTLRSSVPNSQTDDVVQGDPENTDPDENPAPSDGLPALELTAEQNFQIKDSGGNAKTLKDLFVSEYMIIDFSQYWCPSCKALADEEQTETDFHDLVKGTKCRFMVALPEGDRASWLKRYKVETFIGDHSVFSAKQNSIGTAFGLNITGIPHVFMINRKGEVVGQQGGGLPDEVEELCAE